MVRKQRSPETRKAIEALKKMSLPDRQTWIRVKWRLSSTEAWWIGMALLITEQELKDEGNYEGKWTEFLQGAGPGIAYESCRRYMRLAGAIEDPEMLEDVPLNKSYQLCCIVSSKAKPVKPHVSAERSTPGGPDTTPAKPVAKENEALPEVVRSDGDPIVHKRAQALPGGTLSFFAAKVVEQLGALESLPKKERWRDLNVETLRRQLLELQTAVDKALRDLPKSQRNAKDPPKSRRKAA
jgi:hypothetical protein